MKKPKQSAVVDTIGVDDMITMDEATLMSYKARISENSKDRNLLSPPAFQSPAQHHLRQITDISSSSLQGECKYEYPKRLTTNFSIDQEEYEEGSRSREPPQTYATGEIMEVPEELPEEDETSEEERSPLKTVQQKYPMRKPMQEADSTTMMDVSASLHHLDEDFQTLNE